MWRYVDDDGFVSWNEWTSGFEFPVRMDPDAMHGEAVRVLEQGKTILLADGAASATAAGRILLKLASFYADK